MPFLHNRSRDGFFWIFRGDGCGNTAVIPRQNCGKIPRETRGFPMPKDQYITTGTSLGNFDWPKPGYIVVKVAAVKQVEKASSGE